MRNPEITGTVATSWDLGRVFSFDVAYQGIYEWERQEYFGTFLGLLPGSVRLDVKKAGCVV